MAFLLLIILCDRTKKIYWSVNASFGVYRYMKGHTGASFAVEIESLISLSTKKKINARNSTKSEIVVWDSSILNVL